MAFKTQAKSARTMAVEEAMGLLLTKQQINFIKYETACGISKLAMVRKLVSLGIVECECDWQARFGPIVEHRDRRRRSTGAQPADGGNGQAGPVQ